MLGPNLAKFLISDQHSQFSNIIFKINELDLLWEPYFIFGTKFFWNEGLIFVLMSNVCYLVLILFFCWLIGGYCSLPTISFIIFWDFSMFYQMFLSPQVKLNLSCGALPHMKTRNSPRYSSTDCRPHLARSGGSDSP